MAVLNIRDVDEGMMTDLRVYAASAGRTIKDVVVDMIGACLHANAFSKEYGDRKGLVVSLEGSLPSLRFSGGTGVSATVVGAPLHEVLTGKAARLTAAELAKIPGVKRGSALKPVKDVPERVIVPEVE